MAIKTFKLAVDNFTFAYRRQRCCGTTKHTRSRRMIG
jgi:hypothetical protein